MKTEARDIDLHGLLGAINAAYGLALSSLTFLPKGEDAYAYLARASSGTRYFLRVQAAARAGPLACAYATAHALHHRYGLTAVVAPLLTREGACTLEHGRYVVALFPFIEGQTLYDREASDDDLAQAAGIIAALHHSPAAHALPALRQETFDNPFAGPIRRALRAAGDPRPNAGTVQRQVQDLLGAQRADLLDTLNRMEQLGARARRLTTERLLTHGDPNLDNLLKDKAGRLHLTDWDGVALGPAERDLFAFTGSRFGVFLRPYLNARPDARLHLELFRFYFYRWAVQEVADYTSRILFQDVGPQEAAHAWAELQPYLPVPHASIAAGVRALEEIL